MIGNGTGDWDVPVGGMGALTDALARAAREAGAEIRCGAEVTAIDPEGEVRWDGGSAAAEHVLAAVAPPVLARLLGEPAPEPPAEGAQLKVNMLLSRLPRLRDAGRRPARGVRRHLPRQRVGHAARRPPTSRPTAASSRRCRRARSTATR